MLRFQILGAIDLRAADGREIGSVLAQPKRTALLAYLASTAQRFHRRDTLLALFWPESDQARARDSLRQAVRYLRRSLGVDVIIGRGNDELGVDARLMWCDAAAFEQALDAGEPQRALELYRGELLAGFHLSDVPEFEHWLEQERRRLRARASAAAAAQADQQASAGDLVGAVQSARLALALSAADEGCVRRVLTLLEAAGDRAGALHAFEEFAARLAAELDVEPSAETVALAERIRTGPNRGEIVAQPQPTDPAAAATRQDSPATTSPGPPLAATPSPASPSLATSSSAPPAPSRAAPTGGQRRWALAVAGMALLLAGAGGWLLTPDTAPAAPDTDAVVVLPLENRTGDATLGAMGSWAADWITQGLSRAQGLRVVNAGAGLPGGGGAAPAGDELRRLLEQTRASVVLSGAYYRFGDSIQFQVRITDAAGRTAVRAPEPVRGSLAEPRAAVGELAERVTGALAAHRHPWIQALNAEGSQPPSWEAYQAWTDGLVQVGRRDYEAARHHLLHAASLDSSFISPLIWAAGAHFNLREYSAADSLLRIADRRRSRILPFDRHMLDMWLALMRGDLLESHRAVLRMLDTAPTSEVALRLTAYTAVTINHPGTAVEYAGRIRADRSAVDWDMYGIMLTSALHLLGDHDRELEEARRVRERRPELLRAHGDEIRALAALGRGQDVLRRLDRLMALAPQPRVTAASVALTAADELRVHGDEVAADAAVERALAWFRTRPAAEQTTAAHRYALAWSLYRARRWQEAERIFKELAGAAPGQVEYTGYLGAIAAHTGRVAEAEQVATALAELSDPYLWGSATLWRARIAAALGRPEEAVALVRASLAQGQRHSVSLHADPDLAPLRAVPAYRELMTPVR